MKRLRWQGTALLTLGFLVTAGCGSAVVQQPADQGMAVNALTATLDAWKKGDKASVLKERNPPITAFDPVWEKGARLVRYELVEKEARHNGFDLLCPVRLWLDDENGKDQPRRVNYSVATAPRLVVVRDFGGP